MEKTKMLLNSWKASLQFLLTKRTVDSKIAIVGIGNILRSDDGAGVLVARGLMESRFMQGSETVLVMDAGHAPENGTHQLRRFEPKLILLIDAADLGELPGTIRLIGMDEIEGMSASTHSLPLSMLAKYLMLELNCVVYLLGIQPGSTDVGENVGTEVHRAVGQIVEYLIHEVRQ